MKEVPNRVLLSSCHLIKKGVSCRIFRVFFFLLIIKLDFIPFKCCFGLLQENDKLEMLIWKAIDEGLEGLVLKDLDTIYEPGKRHWLKVNYSLRRFEF